MRTGLARLLQATTHPAPALRAIGETLVASTKQRFGDSRGPDGQRWEENTETTLARWLGSGSNVYSKRRTASGGRTLTKKGQARLANKRPLIGETRALSSLIVYQLLSDQAVVVGSVMEYAVTHQFGAQKGEFGRNKRGSPIPWGDIPARPFLGLSADDRQDCLDLLAQHIADSLSGA